MRSPASSTLRLRRAVMFSVLLCREICCWRSTVSLLLSKSQSPRRSESMRLGSKWNRRNFLGSAGVIAGVIATVGKSLAWARAASPSNTAISGFGQSGNVYEELGVPTLINAEGTMTMLGGSLPHPALEAVMFQAGHHFVSMPDLEVAAGKRIAQMLKLPDGFTALVTSGAAAAIQSGLAGILTGNNEKLIQQLPDLTGM